jgi:hypothetical protein
LGPGDEEDFARLLVWMGCTSRAEAAVGRAVKDLDDDPSEVLTALLGRRVYLAHYGMQVRETDQWTKVGAYHNLMSDLIKRENDGGVK